VRRGSAGGDAVFAEAASFNLIRIPLSMGMAEKKGEGEERRRTED